MSKQRFKRSSGIVMPVFSLPSPYGIGTLGKCAYEWIDFLVEAGQSYWQILPLGHTGFGNSPYQCFSTIAGNPYLIDLDMLVDIGLITNTYLSRFDFEYSSTINYPEIDRQHFRVLRTAYNNISSKIAKEVELFADHNSDWIYDYSFFMALKDYFNQKPVYEWDDLDIRKRKPKSIKYYYQLLNDNINFYIFVQFLFFKQWNDLKKYANNKGISIIGDMPIYPSPDSCEIWLHPNLFKVDENLRPYKIAGVPPDDYSQTGQLWGNPVYNWDNHKQQNYSWWIWRIKHTLEIVDVIRLDHFRAFQDYYEIPFGENTAINGNWSPGPRIDFFNAITSTLGDLPIIAEDLGMTDSSVQKLLDETNIPGMNVLIFGLKASENNKHLPHNWSKNSVGYTSIHDSETICQKIDMLNSVDRNFALQYINSNAYEPLGISAIRTALASPADLVMIPVADLLSLNELGRINTPGTINNNNWSWRAPENAFTKKLAKKINGLTTVYKRTS